MNNITNTKKLIEGLPDGAIYSDNDGLDPLAVFPTELTAADLKALAAAVPDWVSVSERLPEEAVDCWITIVDPDFEAPVVTKGGIAYGKWHLALSGMPVFERRTVTAWMPIIEPQPYQEDKDDAD